MLRMELEGAGTFDVEEGRRLVLAIEENAGLDILPKTDKILLFRAVVTQDGCQLEFTGY